jgi:hypothetical protein
MQTQDESPKYVLAHLIPVLEPAAWNDDHYCSPLPVGEGT